MRVDCRLLSCDTFPNFCCRFLHERKGPSFGSHRLSCQACPGTPFHLTLASVFSSSTIFPRTFGSRVSCSIQPPPPPPPPPNRHPRNVPSSRRSPPVDTNRRPQIAHPLTAMLCPVHKSETTASFAGHERRGSESSLTTEKLRTRASQDGTRYFWQSHPIPALLVSWQGQRDTPPGPPRSLTANKIVLIAFDVTVRAHTEAHHRVPTSLCPPGLAGCCPALPFT